ncbi:MAG: glycosyltransferase family 4 protein [Candidatus Aminicenantes bacterium]|nr:glycosyltransferase family 4 protein [Candidatus Aminicenantes bacterium]
MRTGIVFYNKGRKGGAERRYYNIICELSKHQKVYIMANSSVIDNWNKLGGFNEKVVFKYLLKDTSKGENDNIKKSSQTKLSIRNIAKKFFPKKLRLLFLTIFYIFRLNMYVFKWAIKYKITHINTIQASGILVIFTKILGCKIVFSYNDYMVENGYPFRWISNQGLKAVARISDRYDFLSEMIPERMQKMGLKIQAGKIFSPPTSFTNYSNFNISLPKKKKIVFSGRLEKLKNPFLALGIAKELSRRKISYNLLMLGDGSLRCDLEKFIRLNNLDDNVHTFSTNHVENELRDALIFLSLQQENNYPSQALLEAMACGCIPIVTDVGETRKIVNEKNGFLVNENVNQIVEIIIYIFDNIELFEKRGMEIRKNVMQNFNIQSYMKYYLSLFRF